ncbi:unnamed protein product [Ectocarpus sp. CCAP 1310/34]|nr:unnamed protein product [Ectocarpus sp. CCAP 1310/34]
MTPDPAPCTGSHYDSVAERQARRAFKLYWHSHGDLMYNRKFSYEETHTEIDYVQL